ncbi:MAG: DNA polymerase III subunit delta', partial [Ilumatobacteraceae bacterium]|nr:DNA polymerase III subunit delta' [Ilumatobacteraceae bacterium]
MTSTWEAIVGQQVAVNKLQLASINPVHAYLLIGPDGCGKDEAARAFAASLLSTSQDTSDRTSGLVMRGAHPDVHEIRRTGASLLVKDAEEAI